jgi:hypothetical protein
MAVEGNPRRTHMHFGTGQLGKSFLAKEAGLYKVKYNQYPKYEPVPLKTEEDCCCCCGCECTCSLDILGEVIDLTDFTCELNQSFCFVKHQPLTSVIEATQTETYSEPLECGEYPEVGGIDRTITKESRMHSEIVSFIKATVTKGGPWSIEVEQTEKLMTFYYRRITIDLDQTCTIPDSAWQLNPDTEEPEIIDPNYEPSCIKCKLGTLDPLSGAGIKPCCTDSSSEITTCEFSVVDGKGQIHIVGTIKSLWEYEEGKCMKPALNGPTIACKDAENDKRYYDLDSHTWDDARNGRVGCLSPVMQGLGCAGETLRIRRKTWRFVPLLPEYDNDDVADSQCVSYNKGNVEIELMETYDSRTLNLYDADGLYDLEFEIDSTRDFDPNTGSSNILDTPVEVGGDTDTEEYSTDVAFHYTPEAPKCSQCMLTIDIGVDTVEIMEPGCDPYGQFCYFNMELVATYESVHKRITDPLYNCLQVCSESEDCTCPGVGAGIYMEINDEIKERYYVNSGSKVTIFSGFDDNGDRQWYADIEQDDHLVHIFYERKVYITDFGDGCFWNNCGDDSGGDSNDCGPINSTLYDIFTFPPLVGGMIVNCNWESDVLDTACNDDKITLYRVTKEAWGWATVNTLYGGQIFGSACFGPLFVHPPYKEPAGCINKSDPFTEYILPGPAVFSCDVGQGLDGENSGVCGGTGFSYRKHRYILRKRSNRTYFESFLEAEEIYPGTYTVGIGNGEDFETWTVVIGEEVTTHDEFWQAVYDVIFDVADDKEIPEGMLIELLENELGQNIGIRSTPDTVCQEMLFNVTGPEQSGLQVRQRQYDTTPLVNYCKDVKAGDVEWCFLEVLEDNYTAPTLYFEQDGTVFYDRNISSGGFYTPTGATGSGSTAFDVSRQDFTGGSFTIASSLLTVRPEFYMSLGATSIVCPDPPEEE